MEIRLCLNQLRLFVGQGDFGAARIQRTKSRRSIVRADFSTPRQERDRFFAHMDFLAIQEQVVKSEPHIHRHAIDHRLEFVLLLREVRRAIAI